MMMIHLVLLGVAGRPLPLHLGVREMTGPGVDVTIKGVVEDPKFWNPPAEGEAVGWVAGDVIVTGLLLLLPKFWNPPVEGEVVGLIAGNGVGSFHPNSNFFVGEKIETDDFFTVCFLCIDHALCEILDFSFKQKAVKSE